MQKQLVDKVNQLLVHLLPLLVEKELHQIKSIPLPASLGVDLKKTNQKQLNTSDCLIDNLLVNLICVVLTLVKLGVPVLLWGFQELLQMSIWC
jgi:hypothetical protein